MFCEKKFSNKVLIYMKFSALNAPQSDAHNSNWKTDSTMCKAVGFDASLNSERTFLMDLSPKFVKKNKLPKDL